MAFTLYEIWTIDQDSHEELFDTAANLPEAIRVAKSALINDIVEVIVYDTDDNGEAFEAERFKKS